MMMSRFRHIRLLTLFTALVVGVLGVITAASPASAAGCRADSCTGKDPNAQGCASQKARPKTIDEFTYQGVRFELRYSPVCRAAWTKVTTPRHYNTLFAQIRGGGFVYGVQVAKRKEDGATAERWTKMISTVGHGVRSCRAVWFDSSPSANGCTAFQRP